MLTQKTVLALLAKIVPEQQHFHLLELHKATEKQLQSMSIDWPYKTQDRITFFNKKKKSFSEQSASSHHGHCLFSRKTQIHCFFQPKSRTARESENEKLFLLAILVCF